jgi:superfamily II DNA or RNA helicase
VSLVPAPAPFVPRVRLFVERFSKEGLPVGVDIVLPVVGLSFDYQGTVLRMADPRTRFFVGGKDGMLAVERDRAAETRIECLLETCGALELMHAPSLVSTLDTEADYLVQADGNVHSYCSFTAHAVPLLRAQGAVVTLDPDYPYQVVADEPAFRPVIEPDTERPDWFSLQLGIDVEGTRVDILPTLLDMLDQLGENQALLSLLRVAAARRAISVGPNRYVTVRPERLRALLSAIVEVYRGDGRRRGSFGFGLPQAPSVVRLLRTMEIEDAEQVFSAARRAYEVGTRLLEPLDARSASAPAVAVPEVTLRPYQWDGVRWLQKLRELEVGGVLADDMGLGKTLQTIVHLGIEKTAGRLDHPCLIVVPTSLVTNWQRELERFLPSASTLVYHGPRRESEQSRLGSAEIVITSYPVLVRDLELLRAIEYSVVVLDEAQAIKNERSQASQAAKLLVARHRLCLSGTPIENNLSELWSLFDFLLPPLLGPSAVFRSHFRRPIEQAGDEIRLAALRSKVAPFILRRMKEEVARDLPPKTVLTRPVELEGSQRDLYESIRLAAHTEVRRAIRQRGIEGSSVAVLDALMKLRQVCCDPRLVNMPAAEAVHRSAKFELFFDLLERQLAAGRRVLVFSQFARMLSLLSEEALRKGIRHLLLTGKTIDRQRRVDAFQKGEVDVFLISLKAGGTGLNLTRADTVIHYDPWWNASAQAQATDRAHRIGQENPVFIYNLIVSGSVEERMMVLQQRKRWLSESLLDGTAASFLKDRGEVEHLLAPLDG